MELATDFMIGVGYWHNISLEVKLADSRVNNNNMNEASKFEW